MDVQAKEQPRPFDSFTNVYNMLGYCGLYKLIKKPKNRYLHICHQMYRPVAFAIVLIYNTQHVIFLVQMYLTGDADNLIESMMAEIAHLNLLFKFLSINTSTSKFDKIIDLIKSPYFAPQNKKDEEYINENIQKTNKLWRYVEIYGVTFCGVFWFLTPIFKRLQDEHFNAIPIFVPFETTSWPGFCLASVLYTVPVFWIGYGHIAFDFLVGIYYFQAETQLKIIKYNLEHLADSEVPSADVEAGVLRRQYVDKVNANIEKRFVNIVKRYEKVVWYTKEISAVFSNSVTFQFFSSSCILCLVVYKLSAMHEMSVPLASLVLYIVILQVQVLLYCYFGGLVQYESDSVSTAAYMTDWLSLSPKFRKQLAIAMTRWGLQIIPRVFIIIPLSLATFITILRSAYTLFTFMKTANSYIHADSGLSI